MPQKLTSRAFSGSTRLTRGSLPINRHEALRGFTPHTGTPPAPAARRPPLSSKRAPAPGRAPQDLLPCCHPCVPPAPAPQPLDGELTEAARPGGHRHSPPPSAARGRRHGPPPCLFTAARPAPRWAGGGAAAERCALGKVVLPGPAAIDRCRGGGAGRTTSPSRPRRGEAGRDAAIGSPPGGRTTFPRRRRGPARLAAGGLLAVPPSLLPAG